MKRVSYIFPTSHHYRYPFHVELRSLLAAHDVDYQVVYSESDAVNRAKGDTVDIEWGVKVPSLRIGSAIYQSALREALKSDLVILQQENRLLLNYLCVLARSAGRIKLAYFGHGRNFQSRNPDGASERFKRFWATKADWWFAYTDETRRHLETLGMPAERITVFQNAVDTTALKAHVRSLSPAEVKAQARAAGVEGDNVAIFVGGLYEDKRLDFLISAGERVRERIPDFELVVVGGGPQLDQLRNAAHERPWLVVTGPRFGREKVALMIHSKLFLMPGLVGLAILDAAATGLPIVTTAYPWHSPEIAYLESGTNGLVIDDWRDVDAYADAITSLIQDEATLARPRQGALATAELYTIEAMAERFCQGVLRALG